MVDHFIDLTYLHLIRSTNQEDTLEEKASFERWAATFGVNLKDIMQTMKYLPNNVSDQQLRMSTRL